MKCNYKNTIRAYEIRQYINDKTHFSEYGTLWAVGDIYPDFIGNPDGQELRTSLGGLSLICTLRNPSAMEIYNFTKGNLKLALTKEEDFLFVLSKFGDDMWGSTCSNFSVNPNANLVSDKDNLLVCLLFDTSDGKLLGIRTIGLQHDFVKALTDAIKQQAANYCPVELFTEKVSAIYNKFPTDNDLLKNAYCKYDCNKGVIYSG